MCSWDLSPLGPQNISIFTNNYSKQKWGIMLLQYIEKVMKICNARKKGQIWHKYTVHESVSWPDLTHRGITLLSRDVFVFRPYITFLLFLLVLWTCNSRNKPPAAVYIVTSPLPVITTSLFITFAFPCRVQQENEAWQARKDRRWFHLFAVR